MSYGNNKWASGEKIAVDKINDMTLSADNPFYLPAYYLNNINNSIDGILNDSAEGTFSFLWSSDIHLTSTTYKLENIVALAAYIKNLNLDMVCIGGDVHDGYTDKATALRYCRNAMQLIKKEADGVPVLVAKGNHDTNYFYAQPLNDYTQLMYTKDWYMNMVKHAESYGIVRDATYPEGGYYYLDFEAHKIRVIVLNDAEVIEDANGVPTSFTLLKTHTKQYKWFAEQALNLTTKAVPSQWHVLVLSHNIPVSTATFQNYPTVNQKYIDIEQAFKAGTDYINSTSGIYGYFSQQGAGNIIGHIGGHVHIDAYEKVNGIDYATNNCTVPGKRWTASADRTTYSDTMNSLSVYTIDTATRSVKMKKIGAGSGFNYTY